MMAQSKLKNGARLITVPSSGTKAVTLLILFPVGSRYEQPDISGVSHFVEHLMFKGTTNRPTALDISRELDAAGAEFNAFTSKDYTGYYVKIEQAQKEKAFDLLSDMLYNSLFDAAEIEKEKGVIVEELRMYEDNPIMAVDMMFDRAVFGDAHPLGWDIGGSVKTVRGVTREKIFKYYQSHYAPERMIVVAAGAVNSQEAKKLAARYFADKFPGRLAPSGFKKFAWPKKLALAKRVLTQTRKIDQAQVMIGFPGLSYTAPERYTLAVLSNILGGGMSSRLFTEIREKRGLAYMIRTSAAAYHETGVMVIQAGLNPAKLSEAFKAIKNELRKICAKPVADKELREAKSNLHGRVTLAMEDSSAQADWYGKRLLFHQPLETPEESLRHLKAVTVKDVQALAKKIFKENELRAAVISPLQRSAVLKLI